MCNLNVTIFGDSITKGIAPKNNKLNKLKENAVDLVGKYLNININNLSSFGQTLSRAISKNWFKDYIDNIIIDDENLNIAVIALGGNDSDYDWKKVSENPRYSHKNVTPISQFEKKLDNVIKELKASGVEVALVSLSPIDSNRYFKNCISKQGDEKRILEFLKKDISNIYKQEERYNLAILKCANKNNCRVIDIRPTLLMNRAFIKSLCFDGIHPNQNGHKLIAKVAFKEIKQKFKTELKMLNYIK